MAKLLEVKGLNAFYGTTQALFGIDFSLEEGSVTAILGANGAGKTTTLRAICQMVRTSGSILFDGTELGGKQTESVVRMGVAHVPDGRGTFTALTTEENLRLGAYVRRDRAAVADDIDRVYAYFPRLRERRQQQAGTLSGGEQQMLAVSRALRLRPRLLLLDEPSLGLAPLITDEIFAIIQQLARTGTTILLVEQNALMALSVASRGYVSQMGEILLSGSAAKLNKNALKHHLARRGTIMASALLFTFAF